jgi:malate synthase
MGLTQIGETNPVLSANIQIQGPVEPGFESILSPDALSFVATLVVEFGQRLEELLKQRQVTAEKIRTGKLPDFLTATSNVREGVWTIGDIPSDLEKRCVEITGPVDRKMIINALNSGADVYMADFEDSHSPTWEGTMQGQMNLRDAVNGAIEYKGPDGRSYRLNSKTATLVVRPRGLHLKENHVLIDQGPIPASIFDYGLYLFHNVKRLREKRSGPYYYLPKMENHLEARLWNDVFNRSEEILGLPHGTIKCSVLIENILAAFEMEEILFELKDHITALNFGRWDYMFSFIKKLGHDKRFLVPERAQLLMTTHFLQLCSLLLVESCHKRGAYAIGGMAAQVPIKNNPTASADALDKVVLDKQREVAQGYDGAWVAHPGLVPVVMSIFMNGMKGPNQLKVRHHDLKVTAGDLLMVPSGTITEAGLRGNISVSLRYLESWLRGVGCVAINNLMEDTATVEISRSLIWQWIHHHARLTDGREISPELFHSLLMEELAKAEAEGNGELLIQHRFIDAAQILDRLSTSPDFVDFMTIEAYPSLDQVERASWDLHAQQSVNS